MNKLAYSISLVVCFSFGLLLGQFQFFGLSSSTNTIVSKASFKTDSGIYLPKGTKFRYVESMPEGYIAVDLAIALEGEALEFIDYELDGGPGTRHQYFISQPSQ